MIMCLCWFLVEQSQADDVPMSVSGVGNAVMHESSSPGTVVTSVAGKMISTTPVTVLRIFQSCFPILLHMH